jgi:hypothetical protein
VISIRLRRKFSCRIRTNPSAKGILLADKLAGLGLFIRELGRGFHVAICELRVGRLLSTRNLQPATLNSQPITSRVNQEVDFLRQYIRDILDNVATKQVDEHAPLGGADDQIGSSNGCRYVHDRVGG